MDTPLVSVILATYNGSRFLSEAIESVLSQEYLNLELIIIDDTSTDDKVSPIIEKFKTFEFIFIETKEIWSALGQRISEWKNQNEIMLLL